MKKLLLPLLALSLSLGFFSCSTDFKVAAPYKDITIVYGLLDVKDTAHYIRIQKAFLDEQASAFDMAKVSDSSFYNALDVKVKEMSGSSVVNTFTLTKVDMKAEGYPKDSGTFFRETSYGYKFKGTLNASHSYLLEITNPLTGQAYSSQISIIDAKGFAVPKWNDVNYSVKFAQTAPASTKFSFFGNTAPANTKVIDAILRFKWTNKNVATGVETDDSADFRFDEVVLNNSFFNLETTNLTLYNFLHDAIQDAPANVDRYMDSCNFYFYAGGTDFYNYEVVNNTLTSGLTADQVRPIFSNITGKDVYGLFSSRTDTQRLNVPIDVATLDSLMINPITKSLNIKGRSTH